MFVPGDGQESGDAITNLAQEVIPAKSAIGLGVADHRGTVS